VLWIISHPEDVAPAELLGFDVVYAASDIWAREMSARCGRSVLSMHQAVDTEHLHEQSAAPGRGHQLLFVGGTHPERHRQSVYDAAKAGVDLVVHGPGWRETPIAPYLASDYVPNHELTALYRSNGLVLADHWPDMAAHGFIANRVFDAVAAGARVVSDDVVGIEETFAGAVQVYRSIDELTALCGPEGRSRFPSDEEMSRIADAVREQHSFDARARVLLDEVTAGLRALSRRNPVGG
jgi:spore maturation protein CgeB